MHFATMTTTQALVCLGAIAPTLLTVLGLSRGKIKQRSVPRRWVLREAEPGRYWLHIGIYLVCAVGFFAKGIGAF